MKPPEGGPKDEEPPKVTGILPEPGSSGVDRNTSINIAFSEKIDGDSFKKLIQIYPPVEFSGIGARGEGLEIKFREELPETTICVFIRKGYTDQHRVKGEKGIEFCFSTADSIDTGRISGLILFKMLPDSTGLAKLVALSDVDSTGDITRAPVSRLAVCGSDGSFSFRSLPTGGKGFRLWALTDRNSDTRLSPSDEFWTVLEDTFALSDEMPAIDGLEINIIDPDEPGSIEGKIEDLTGLETDPSARFDPLFEEGAPVLVRADSTGVFNVKAIPPGEYIFTAFMDVFPDSLPGSYADPSDSTLTLAEPFAVYPDTVAVQPGSKVILEPVYIQRDGKKDE
jgi:hypothetical protein